MVCFDAFRPIGVEQIPINHEVFDEPVSIVNDALSRLSTQHFFDEANRAKSLPDGMQHLLVGGEDDRSKHTAIAMPGTFGNGIWPHLVARAEALATMTKEAGLRDDDGRLVPVLITASPSMKSRFNLSKLELSDVSDGDFNPVVERQAHAMREHRLKQLVGAVGTSLGSASIARLMTRFGTREFDKGQAVFFEPAHGLKRGVIRQLIAFGRESSGFKSALAAENIQVINDLFASGSTNPDFEKGIFNQAAENYAQVKGLGQGGLQSDTEKLRKAGVIHTVVRGTDSHVAPAKIIDGLRCPVLEVVGGNHSLADRVGRFAVIAAANLTRTDARI